MPILNNHETRLAEIISCVNPIGPGNETAIQVRGKMEIVDVWGPKLGDRVLEIGCGQGGMTVVLAAAVGESGYVLGVDSAPEFYGSPTTLRKAQARIKASSLGQRIEFRTSTDILKHDSDLGAEEFDLVVFSHVSWYMDSPDVLRRLFERVRPWSRRLGYAEWDARIHDVRQAPHLLGALLQSHVQTVWSGDAGFRPNIRCLVLPSTASGLANDTGWRIVKEASVDSTEWRDGREWEPNNARLLARQLTSSTDRLLSSYVRDTIGVESDLIGQLSDPATNLALSTYVFLAE